MTCSGPLYNAASSGIMVPMMNDAFKVGSTYMARRRFNSKSITWEPCVLLGETGADGSYYHVRFLEDGMSGGVRKVHKQMRKRGGKYELVEEPGLRLVTSAWIAAEQKKVDALKDEARRKQEMIDRLIGL